MTAFFDSFVFGAANSLHCACMCGPLALACHGGAAATAAYHGARTVAYTGCGLLLGGVGQALGARGLGEPSAWVALVLALGLTVLALAGERFAVRIPGLGSLLSRAMQWSRSLSPTARAALVGLFTPLLPCGLLWAACAGAAVAGSPLAGGGVMAGFALGVLPMLLLAQTQVGGLARRFGARKLQHVQRAVMLIAAAMLAWRGLAALHGSSCCH